MPPECYLLHIQMYQPDIDIRLRLGQHNFLCLDQSDIVSFFWTSALTLNDHMCSVPLAF